MVKQLKAIGGSVIGIGTTFFRVLQLMWYLGFLFFGAMLVYDLCRIPISVNSSHEYAPERTLWAKMSPEEEARLLERQEHCRHVYVYNGYPTYYCTLCRKKLVKDRPPIWQI